MHFITTATIFALVASLALAVPIPGGPGESFAGGAGGAIAGQVPSTVAGALYSGAKALVNGNQDAHAQVVATKTKGSTMRIMADARKKDKEPKEESNPRSKRQ